MNEQTYCSQGAFQRYGLQAFIQKKFWAGWNVHKQVGILYIQFQRLQCVFLFFIEPTNWEIDLRWHKIYFKLVLQFTEFSYEFASQGFFSFKSWASKLGVWLIHWCLQYGYFVNSGILSSNLSLVFASTWL